MVDLPLFVIEPLIGVSILYWMVGLNPLPERFLMACVIVLLVVQVTKVSVTPRKGATFA